MAGAICPRPVIFHLKFRSCGILPAASASEWNMRKLPRLGMKPIQSLSRRCWLSFRRSSSKVRSGLWRTTGFASMNDGCLGALSSLETCPLPGPRTKSDTLNFDCHGTNPGHRCGKVYVSRRVRFLSIPIHFNHGSRGFHGCNHGCFFPSHPRYPRNPRSTPIPSDLGPSHFNRGLHGFHGYQSPYRSPLASLPPVNRTDHAPHGVVSAGHRRRRLERATELFEPIGTLV